MRGSQRERRRRRHFVRAMRKVGLRSCGCCEIIDDRRQREVAAAIADLRSESIGGKVKL